jgi:cation diffusion facilitator family transporter
MNQPNKPTAQWTFRAELRMVTLSLALGALLVAVKLLAYYLTKSAAIFSDAIENIVNVLSSGFALYAVELAHRPADQEHPYGHGKVEFLSAGFEGGMILLAAILILVRAGESLAFGQGPRDLGIGILITAFSALLCFVTGLILRRHGIRAGSMTLEADGVHLLSDAVTGAAVTIALLIVRMTGWQWLDPAAAVVVSVWIAAQAARLVRRAAAGLMDEQDAADTVLLKRILDGHVGASAAEPRICSYHKLRHRHSGRLHWVDFHIQVPAEWAVERGHQVATTIEMEIEKRLIQSSATAHVEPCIDAHCPRCVSP